MSPTPRLIVLALIMAVPLFLGWFNRNIADLALLANLMVLTIAIVDLLISPAPRRISVRRDVPDVLSVATRNPASLHFTNRSRVPLAITVHDDPGPLAETIDLPQTVRLEPWKEQTVTYALKPFHRGENRIGPVWGGCTG